MRLHLPKGLLAAILAACAALPGWASTSVTVGNTTVSYDSLTLGTTLPTDAVSAFWLSGAEPGSKVEVKNTAQGSLNKAGTIILGSGSYTTTTTDEEGNPVTTTPTSVTATQLFLQGWGSSAAINVTSALIVGGNSGEDDAALRFGADGSYDVKVSGDITVADNAKFMTGGTHAVISGSISGNNTTLTLSNKVSAGVYTMTGDPGKSISLSGLTISGNTVVKMNYESVSLGTLTLNSSSDSAALTLSGSGTVTIASLVTGGNVLDAGGMTGNLTINGATWTGSLVDASVAVVKAKDAGTATALAAAMDLTHGLSYRFSADGSTVYRTLRTEYYKSLTATTVSSGGRIVIGSIVYDGKTFNNVALKDLVAGDKVTLGTPAAGDVGAQDLTGWIGYNGETILADLEFADGTTTSVNNGNAGGTITYVGAITGGGTLSFDWYGDNPTATKNTYVFNGDLSGFSGKIKDDATLNVTIGGETPASDEAKVVNATIDIAGALTVNREASFTKGITVGGKLIINADTSIAAGTVSGNMDLKSGALTINGNVTLNGSLDMKGGETTGGACLGHVVISETGKLKVSKDMWGLADSAKILLKEGGSLEWNGLTFTGQAEKADVDTGLTFGSDAKLSLTDAHFATNTSIAFSETGEKTLSWTLAGCSIEVRNGTLNVNGTNTNTSLSVSSGSVVFTSSTSLTDSTVSGGNLQFNGSQTILNGTLTISGGVAENTATGDNTEIRLGTAGKVSIESGSLINDGFTYSNNGANASITGNGQSTLKVYEGNVVLKDVVMEKTVSGDKGIGIAMDNVSLIVNAGTTTLRKDGEGKTQSLSSVTVGSDATLKVENAKVSFGSASVSGKLVVEKETKITGAATISGTAEVKGTLSTGAGSTITTLTGSGALKSTAGAATVSDASGFTGTLESTGGALTATNVSSTNKLAAVKATGGQISLYAKDASVSVAELTIGTNGQTLAYTGQMELGTVTADKVSIGESNAKFQGNLNITGGLTVQVGSNGQTGGLNMAAAIGGAATGTLTLGSATGTGLELNLSYIPVMTTGETLTLFTGVNSVLYYEIISAGTGETEASAVTLSDPTPIALTETAVDASNVFNNVDSGYFTVKFVGNNVILTASTNVPEPTTATLSLLALMGLAARRRRKA